jgi:hypothetical protein
VLLLFSRNKYVLAWPYYKALKLRDYTVNEPVSGFVVLINVFEKIRELLLVATYQIINKFPLKHRGKFKIKRGSVQVF